MIWTYAFFLTAGGAYNYKGCSPDIPSSNILVDACRKHAYTMQHCRTDASNAWRTAAWVRIPYPLQWGVPIFHFRTSLIMIIASLVASVDSVSKYKCTNISVFYNCKDLNSCTASFIFYKFLGLPVSNQTQNTRSYSRVLLSFHLNGMK